MLPQCGRGLHHREHISRPLDRCPSVKRGDCATLTASPMLRFARIRPPSLTCSPYMWQYHLRSHKGVNVRTFIPQFADKRLEDGLSINIKRGNVGYKQRTKHLTTATYLPKRKVVYQPCSRLRVVRQPLKVWEWKWGYDRYRQYVATALPMVLALLRQSLLVVTTLTLF